MSAGYNVLIVGVTLLVAIIGIQTLLSTRKSILFGFLIPALFLFIAGYNLYRSLFVYNPYPTMAEGIYMTSAIVGFVISFVTLIVCRIIVKRK